MELSRQPVTQFEVRCCRPVLISSILTVTRGELFMYYKKGVRCGVPEHAKAGMQQCTA